jgi:two-component system, OmpR family, sensor kinase
LSLRARLLAGLIGISVAGVVVLSVVTYTSQRSFLLSRVDQQAVAAATAVSFQLDQRGITVPGGTQRRRPPTGPGGSPPPGSGVSLPSGTFGERRDAAGKPVGHVSFTYGQTALPAPQLPRSLPVSSPAHPRLVTVGSVGTSGLRYRVLVFPTGDQPGTTLVAIPLREVDQTLARLLGDEAIVGGAVLLSLVLLAWWVIRIGLRPLDRIGEDAGAIAGGELGRRVTPASTRTEVGRLGLALNAMLHRIEEAFDERQVSEERLRRFIADASHELRTPLASIRGYAELFRMGAVQDSDELERVMRRIEEESMRMGVLVEDLLLLARLDEVPQSSSDRVDLAELATDAAADARATAPDRAISLTLREPVLVRGDAHQLRQVLANLMRNAIVHTPAGTPIELHAEGNGQEVTLEVRDHGPGLPPTDDSAAVFERFWRAGAGRERGPAGAGLGLAIVAAVVKAHGGQAQAGNASGGGARFTVKLPALNGGAPEQ